MGDDTGTSLDLTRRQLLIGSSAALIAWMAGCSDDAGDTTAVEGVGSTTTRPAPDLGGDPFTLGVASGDPRPDAVVLWTRLAPEPLADDGLGGMPDQEVDVAWEVATDDGFTDVVRSGVAVASPDHAHAVHADVDGLEPGTDYRYRFTVGDHTTAVARTRTLPEGSPERFGIGVVNCQWFETGTYAAYRNLVRFDPPDGADLAIYQHLDVGDLARIYVLDQRQDSDVPPCRDTVANDFGDCAERASDRTRLGEAQEAWFADAIAGSTATWNLIGNPVVLAGVDGGNAADGSAYYLDTWDGFPTARHRFIEQLAQVDNPVVLTGDYHAGMVLDVDERPFEDSPLVAPEFMAPPISSPLFPADVSARTPQLRQQINAHGYLTATVEPARVTVQFRVLDDLGDPASGISTAATWVVDAGSPDAHPAEAG